MKNEKIKGIIFGTGYYWKMTEPYLREKLEITSYMDNYAEFVSGKERTYLPEQWKELDFDKIVICVMDFHTKLEMMNQLLDLGVKKERIGFIEEFHKNYNIEIKVIDKNTVELYANGVHVQCENEVEYMIAQQIFAEEEYGFHTKDNYFVIDIGLNIGCASLYFASKSNITTVYGFELSKEVYEKAVNNISSNRKEIADKIAIYNIGLGGKDCREKFATNTNKSYGVKIVRDGIHNNATNLIELEVKQASNTLSEIFSKHKEKCLLKIDCEGAEYEILEDLFNSGELKRVDSIVMEWHDGKYKILENLLEKAGYEYVLTKGYRSFGKCYAWKL